MKVVVIAEAGFAWSPRGFDLVSAPKGAEIDLPDALAPGAIEAGKVRAADERPRRAPANKAAKRAPETS